MPMTFEERVAVVERLTAAASASPRRYRLRTLAWIALGYTLVGALLALSVLLSVGVIVLIVSFRAWFLFKVAWIPIVFAFAVGRLLFVRLTPPSGRVLQRGEAPKLFAMIDDIRERLRVPRLDTVMIATDMNAAVVETPRFGGLLGWRRHLLIGIGLLIAQSSDEVKAVLAHEL